jgi:SAM-dependent methyltransferase
VARILVNEDWSKFYSLPPPGNMMENHQHRERVFVNQGTSMAQAVMDCIAKYRPACDMRGLRILDFGCGAGRVTLPLFYTVKKPDNAVDVDPAVIEYVNKVEPGVHAEVSSFQPPLRFLDDTFDVVYAISVWTHLALEAAEEWLTEIKRILRPGGLALLTTSNYAVLAQRRQHPKLSSMGWKDISDDNLRDQGFIFLPTPSTPGTGEYGMASHDPGWIRREWSKHMPVIGIEPGAILGVQDINILMKGP